MLADNTPLHLLQKKIGIMHGDFERNLVAFQRQEIASALGRALERLISLVETRGTLQRNTLLTLGSIGETVRVDVARQLAITDCQLLEIQTKCRLKVEQGEMTRSTHDISLRR